MKVFILGLMLMSATLAHAANWKKEAKSILKKYDYACRTVAIDIQHIVRNDYIDGFVSGLPTEAYSEFKMIFYVKTNRWYIHPYNHDGEHQDGYSFSSIKEDGSFRIKTIKRDVAATKLAAVLVPKPYKIQNQHRWMKPFLGLFGGFTKHACRYELIDGNGDFFTQK